MPFEENVPHPHGANKVEFHRKQFLAERIGWAAMGLFLAWALLGGFGDGWLSRRAVSSSAQTCAVEYQRFGRRDAPFELRVRLRLDDSRERVALHLNQGFLDRATIERMTPAYHSTQSNIDGVIFSFAVEPEAKEHSFTITYRPQRFGFLHAALHVNGETGVTFDQFIYP